MDDLIICPKCRRIYEMPRLLPCGETICSNCILKSQVDTNFLKCVMCKSIHEIPLNGFPINKQTLKLIDRVKTKNEIDEDVNRIEKNLLALKNKMFQSTDIIKSHCDKLRQQIYEKKSDLVQQINRLSNEFTSIVDEFELKSITSFEDNSAYKDSFNLLTKEIDQFLIDYRKNCIQGKLNSFTGGPNEESTAKFVNKSIKLINKYIIMIDNESFKLDQAIFNQKSLIFKQNDCFIEPDLLGKLNFKETNYYNTKKLRKVYLKTLFSDKSANDAKYAKNFEKILLNKLDNGSYLIVYKLKNKKNIELNLLDSEDGTLIKAATLSDYSQLNDFQFVVFKNNIFINLKLSTETAFVILDENLKIVKQKKNVSKFGSIAVNDSYVFETYSYVFNHPYHKYQKLVYEINCFDWKLEPCSVFQKNDLFAPFYNPETVCSIKTKNGKIYLNLKDNMIRIINDSGKLLNIISNMSFDVNMNDYLIDSRFNFIFYVANKLTFFNFNCEKVHEKSLANLKPNMEMFIDKNDNLYFYDKYDLVFYEYYEPNDHCSSEDEENDNNDEE
jgi:hypothetical protein